MTTQRPTFIQSKGEARKYEGMIDTTRIIEHYRDVARGSFDWSGLPEDMPIGYIEDSALFFNPGVSVKRVKGLGLTVLPAKPVNLTVYGTPYKWLPCGLPGITPGATDDTGLFQESDTPVLWFGASKYDRILPFVQLMSRTLKTLGQNLVALSQPVMISGKPSGACGDNIGGVLLRSDMADGQQYIPVVEPGALGIDVLDLGAQDNTQNLISTYQMCDAVILELIQASNGVEKTSGISDMETLTGSQSLRMAQTSGLELRKDWCDRINDRLKMDVSVSIGKGWEQPETEEVNDDGDGGDQNEV